LSVSVKQNKPIVAVIDDDPNVREALQGLLQSVGLRVEAFGDVQEFLRALQPERFGCLILDVRLPGQSGLDFQDDLVKANVLLPIIFISAHADVPMSVRAMKAGAIEFLTKPVRHQDLLDAIQRAIERFQTNRESDKVGSAVRAGFDSLTPREREVMTLVVAGHLNKQIAIEIGLTEATVKLHRGQVMRKMQAKSLPDLVRMADKLSATGIKS
jgi:FixJ family two-component response regulator